MAMGGSISIKASAKINIGLRIGQRASDGYHPIQSVFQSISLDDEIILEWSDVSSKKSGEKDLIIEGDFDCPPEKTTLYKAARIFMSHCGLSANIRLKARKIIPAKAGLGGGSADAAAVLALFNAAFNAGVDDHTLSDLALRLGSDVPFFIHGGTALVSGRGERLKKLPPLREVGILLVCPTFSVSTPWAYAKLDQFRQVLSDNGKNAAVPGEVAEAEGSKTAALLSSPLETWPFKNDFSPMLYKEFPEYAALEKAFRALGAGFVSISGSGSSMYGLFESRAEAEEAHARIVAGAGGTKNEKALYGMALHAIKPLETSLRLG